MIDKALVSRAMFLKAHYVRRGLTAHAELIQELLTAAKDGRNSGRKDRTCKRKKSKR